MIKKYELNQISQLIDLFNVVDEQARIMHVNSYEVYFSISFVMKKLSLTRYYAKKLIEALLENDVIFKEKLRYRIGIETPLVFAVSNHVRGY